MGMSEQNILELQDIRKSFFGAPVLRNITLSVRRGEVLGLVGENGAGKSTLMNILGGVLPKDSGSMTLNGQPYEPVNPKAAQKAGIAFIHQELNLFSNLTVAENIFIDDLPTGFLGSVQYAHMRDKAQAYISQFGVQASPTAKVGTLPMGVRQTIEITKALMKNAEIIIFDEPTTSLSQKEKENLFKVIDQLKARGVTIIYISHILEDVFAHCDTIAVLRDGSLVGVEPTAQIDKPRVIKMMVGRELSQVYPSVTKDIGECVFEARNIHYGKAVCGVSFGLSKGEIVGLFGLMGAGRTELARCLFGVEPFDTGEVIFNGKSHTRLDPQTCIANGMAFVTEDRRQEGLMMPKTVKDNLVLARLDQLMDFLGMVRRRSEDECASQAVQNLSIRVHDMNHQQVKSLSGGNQQKVVIGKWLLRKPVMFIMDEPTRGVDVGSKHEIYTIINQMAKEGATVLFVSSEMEELMGVSDRILVMCKGRLAADLPRKAFDQNTIIRYALGGAE
jgi:ribose transport system ATP-binding protein